MRNRWRAHFAIIKSHSETRLTQWSKCWSIRVMIGINMYFIFRFPHVRTSHLKIDSTRFQPMLEAAHAMRPIDRLIKVISNTNFKIGITFFKWHGQSILSRLFRPCTAAWDFNLCKCVFSSLLYTSYVGSMMMYAFYFWRRQMNDDSPNVCSHREQKPVFRLTRVARTHISIWNKW